MTIAADKQHAGNGRGAWLPGLCVYLGTMAAGNLAWESLQLPLYTIWQTAAAREQAFAVIHCTLGDILIALCTVAIALLAVGDGGWPARRFWPVAIITVVCGVGYTVFSEWLNVVVRSTWAYSGLMPILSLFGLKIGLSPLLQWIVVPAAAFTMARRTRGHRGSGRVASPSPN